MEVIGKLKAELLKAREERSDSPASLDYKEGLVDVCEFCLRRFEAREMDGALETATEMLKELLPIER